MPPHTVSSGVAIDVGTAHRHYPGRAELVIQITTGSSNCFIHTETYMSTRHCHTLSIMSLEIATEAAEAFEEERTALDQPNV